MIHVGTVLLSALVLFSSARGQDLRFSATPSNVVIDETENLEIHCQSPKVDEVDNLIILIQVDQLGDDDVIVPLASDRGTGPTLHAEDERITVEGQLRGGAYIKVMIADPGVADTGRYQCRFAYLHMAEFRFVVLNKTLEVNYTEPGEPTPPPVILEDCTCEQVWAEVKDLRETVIAENRKLKDQLKSYNDSCRVSFTAQLGERSGTKFHSNRILVFDSVLTNKGEAYDAESGVFTAPCGGQYFFRLSMRSHQSRDSGYVDGAITVNEVEVARTSVFSDNPRDHYEQASNGLVLTLKEGDKVMVKTQTNSAGKIYGDVFSIFAGFFISA